MKRTVPLLIAAIVGFVMIVSFFIPATEGWGEVAAIWFDLLAAIATRPIPVPEEIAPHLQKAIRAMTRLAPDRRIASALKIEELISAA